VEAAPVLIEIFSDIVCPWCYIGKRRLDQALAAIPSDGIGVRWRAFQLYPMLPPEGRARDAFVRDRFGAAADPERIYARVLEAADAAGLTLDFSRIRRAPNTRRAHALLAWAAQGPAQHAVAEGLFEAYFRNGLDVGDPEVLAGIAAGAGYDPGAARVVLESGEMGREVDADLARAATLGITGVPFFVLGGRFAVSGAQDPDTLGRIITRARERLARADGA
jgi:predicted DsbA family dithiol-disulfide isomerase